MPGLFRLLLLIAAIYLFWRLAQRLLVKRPRDNKDPEAFEPMARCSACETYMPRRQLEGEPPRCERCRGDASKT